MSRVWWRIPLVLLVSNSVSGTSGSASGRGPHTIPPPGHFPFQKFGCGNLPLEKSLRTVRRGYANGKCLSGALLAPVALTNTNMKVPHASDPLKGVGGYKKQISR